MFSKNLKYYRLKNKLSKKELAELAGLSSMAITHYENGDRKPDMKSLQRLAEILHVFPTDFLRVRNQDLVFHHGEFRKNNSLSKSEQDFVRESIEEYINRFMIVLEVLGGEILPPLPSLRSLQLSDDAEEDARRLREHLQFPPSGPIGNLTEHLENIGFLIYYLGMDHSVFSGMNGLVNGHAYMILNQTMTPERNRSTMAHELAHLMFDWSTMNDPKKIEAKSTAISGAFLFPKQDAIRELGLSRKTVSKDMISIAKEYGISMFLLVKRARLCGIINEHAEKDFYIRAAKLGWRKNEPGRIPPEEAGLFKQLVCRAVNEQEISIQKGAELLCISYDELLNECCFSGGD